MMQSKENPVTAKMINNLKEYIKKEYEKKTQINKNKENVIEIFYNSPIITTETGKIEIPIIHKEFNIDAYASEKVIKEEILDSLDKIVKSENFILSKMSEEDTIYYGGLTSRIKVFPEETGDNVNLWVTIRSYLNTSATPKISELTEQHRKEL